MNKVAAAIKAAEEKKAQDERFARLETKVEELAQQIAQLVATLQAQAEPSAPADPPKGKSR